MPAKPKKPRPHEVRALVDRGLTRKHEIGRAVRRSYDVRDLEALRKRR